MWQTTNSNLLCGRVQKQLRMLTNVFHTSWSNCESASLESDSKDTVGVRDLPIASGVCISNSDKWWAEPGDNWWNGSGLTHARAARMLSPEIWASVLCRVLVVKRDACHTQQMRVRLRAQFRFWNIDCKILHFTLKFTCKCSVSLLEDRLDVKFTFYIEIYMWSKM